MLEEIFNPVLVQKVYYPVLTVLLGIIFYQLGRKAIMRMFDIRLRKKSAAANKREKTIESLVINIYKYVLSAVVILIILGLYGIDTTALLASLGVVGLVVGLACQDTIKDLLAGVFMIFDNAYNVGDYVSVDNFDGEVIEFGLKSTKIRSYKGEIKTIMNSTITSIINYTSANAVKMIDIGVDYGTDLDKCEKVLTELCERLSKEIDTLKADLELLGIQEIEPSRIVYRIRMEAAYLDSFALKRQLLKEIKIALDKNKVKIPHDKLEVVYEK